MTTIELSALFQRDIEKLIAEIGLFRNEEDCWKVTGSIRNTAGNLALHIVGGLNFHIGATLAHSHYTRDRDQEFSRKDVPRSELIDALQALIPLINNTLAAMPEEQLQQPHPIFFDKEGANTGYVLTQLLIHLNYHLGQVNYLRRALE